MDNHAEPTVGQFQSSRRPPAMFQPNLESLEDSKLLPHGFFVFDPAASIFIVDVGDFLDPGRSIWERME
jgi:hypothetical protein